MGGGSHGLGGPPATRPAPGAACQHVAEARGATALGGLMSLPGAHRLLVVIPAYNEAANLPRVVDEIRRRWTRLEILVVDDASEDTTRLLLPTLSVRWLTLPQHLGLGGAMRAGLRFASLTGHD